MRGGIPDKTDVLIAGAGPAGLSAAVWLNKKGISVVLVDAGERIGYPLRCAEMTRESYFEYLGIEPRPGWRRWQCRERESASHALIIIDRPKIESSVAAILSEKGVSVHAGCAVSKVGAYDGKGRKVKLLLDDRIVHTHASVIIAADGVSSNVARLAGINTMLGLYDSVSCFAVRLVDTKIKRPNILKFEHYHELHPHYFWCIPTGPKEANIGLGLYSVRGHAAWPLLEKYMKMSKEFKGGQVAEKIVGSYPFKQPLQQPFTDGMLVVGTAARLIGPAGNGIWYAAASGQAAAQTIIESNNHSGKADLKSYGTKIQGLCDEIERHFSLYEKVWKK